MGANGLSGEGEVGKGHRLQVPKRYWYNGSQFPLVLPLLLLLLLLLLFCTSSLLWCLRLGCDRASVREWVSKRRATRTSITMFAFISCIDLVHAGQASFNSVNTQKSDYI